MVALKSSVCLPEFGAGMSSSISRRILHETHSLQPPVAFAFVRPLCFLSAPCKLSREGLRWMLGIELRTRKNTLSGTIIQICACAGDSKLRGAKDCIY